MYISHPDAATIGLIILLLFPILRNALKDKLFNNFSLLNLTKIFNKSLLFQVITGFCLTGVAALLSHMFYSKGDGNIVAAILIETDYYYIVIGIFMYLPGLGILNLINWLNQK